MNIFKTTHKNFIKNLAKILILSSVSIFYTTLSPVVSSSKKGDKTFTFSSLSKAKRAIVDHVTTTTTGLNLPPFINLFSADIKYDGEQIKFCELEHGFYGTPELFFYNFWLDLKQFNIPICYIGKFTSNCLKQLTSPKNGNVKVFNNPYKFIKYYRENYVKNNNFSNQKKPNKISNFDVIVGFKDVIYSKTINMLRKKYPKILLLNSGDAVFNREKDKIHEFFNCEELREFRPKSKIYPTKHTPELASLIQKDIPCELYVIKPNSGSGSRGVVLAYKDDLDAELKKIFENKNNFKELLIEEFAKSKTIYHNNRPYDPTLRATFVAYGEGNKITTRFIYCCWNLPEASLEEDVDLTKKHISVIGKKIKLVNKYDLDNLKKIFEELAPAMFVKMLPDLI